MHEFSLYGQVPSNEHGRMLQQLAGVARMQPRPVQEIHLVFKSQTPPALADPGGGPSGEKQQEYQRIMRLLNTGLYYIQVVGRVNIQYGGKPNGQAINGDVEMTDGENSKAATEPRVQWNFEFKDTPDPGKQMISTRLIARVPMEDGNVMEFMKQLGYDYVSRYMVAGDKFFDQNTSIFLYRVMRIPEAERPAQATDHEFLDKPDEILPLDGSGGYVLHVSIDAVEGNNQDVKDRAASQLLALKETLKQAVNLTPGDRLALDTRLPAVNRRL